LQMSDIVCVRFGIKGKVDMTVDVKVSIYAYSLEFVFIYFL